MNRNTKYGLIYAIISIFVGGIIPVVVVEASKQINALDSLIFSGMSSIFQVLFFIPIIFIEKWLFSKKSDNKVKEVQISSTAKFYFGKSKGRLYIIVGLSTAVIYYLYFEGLALAGAINGFLALKTTVIFGLVYGFFLLKERITKIQVVFAVILFFGLIIAETQGNFQLLELNQGVIMILICAALWMVVHTCTKPYLSNEIAASSELVVARNSISALILVGSYIIFFGEQIGKVLDPVNAFFYISMGLLYGTSLFAWYKMLKFLDVYLTTIIITPQIIVTSLLGVFISRELFSPYHAIGIAIIIGSIIIINQQAKNK